ncbi:MAG TPA: tetratricopeptide repeat protein [Terriglobales bacterium]
MSRCFSTSLAIAALLALAPAPSSWAGDLKISIPRHSELTPVQKLNREGVEAVQKHQYEKAETLFLKAYLYDPADPFTLNNLGYIAELQGQLQRALQFYQLAAKQGTDASIDRSNAKDLEGKPMVDALNGLSNAPMRVNHINVQAVGLLSEKRNSEAEQLLQQAYTMDPRNAFTLNNLGVAKESTGDYDEALKYFDEAAELRSPDPVVVTLDRAWRGKSVSEMAADSAKKLKKRLRNIESPEQQAALLAVRGVSATNRNDWKAARADFLKAYSLDPGSAFSLNNLGYVSERDGDLETAHFFYTKALQAGDAGTHVGLASSSLAEGQPLGAVATDSNQKIGGEIDRYRRERQAEPGNVELERRDGTPVEGSRTAPTPRSPEAPAPNTATPAPNPATPPPNTSAPAPNPSAPQNPPQ